MSVASVGDMTGDGQPDIAIGAPHADFNGTDSGSVWIISAHLPPIVGCTQASPTRRLPVDQAQQPHCRRRATASTARRPATSSAPRWRASATRTATASATSRSARPAPRRTVAPGAGEVVVVAGRQPNPATAQPRRDAPAADDHRPRGRRRASARRSPRRATSAATATSTCWSARPARRARQAPPTSCIGAAGTTSDLAQAAAKIAPRGRRLDDRQRARGRARRSTAQVPMRSWRRPARTAAARGSWSAAAARRCCPRRPARRHRPRRRRCRRPRRRRRPSRPRPLRRLRPRRRTADDRDHGRHEDDAERARRHGHDHDRIDDGDAQDAGQADREEEKEEAPALPAQEAEGEVQDRQGQASEGQDGALPPAPEDEGDRQERVMLLEHPGPSAHCTVADDFAT